MMNELPEGLPPVPDGAVYLGKGGKFQIPVHYQHKTLHFDGWFCRRLLVNNDLRWVWVKSAGVTLSGSKIYQYAASADSDIARLNGINPESNAEQD